MKSLPGHIPSDEQQWTWIPLRQPIAHLELALVLVVERPREVHDRCREGAATYTVAELTANHSIQSELRKAILKWVTREGLRCVAHDPWMIELSGDSRQVESTFNLGFEETQVDHVRRYRPQHEPELPEWMMPYVTAVVGLDNLATAQPHYHSPQRLERLANNGQGFFPDDIIHAYRLPAKLDGSGQTIGILEFSNGYSLQDLHAFWSAFQVPRPTVDWVSVDGTPNDGGISSVDMEATLDLSWAGAIAPGARLVVYEASAGTSDRSFGLSVLRALHAAIYDPHHHVSVISISYGDGETRFAPAVMRAWDQLMMQAAAHGIAVLVSSGDQGAYGLHGPGTLIPHVDAPANCPHAIAVGGTHLELSGGLRHVEIGWTDVHHNGASGGGFSRLFAVPGYQERLRSPRLAGLLTGRAVPDVALNADPDTGYAIVFQGQATVVGGTSAAAPIWAAVVARCNQALAERQRPPIAFLGETLYALFPSAFHDILVGDNSYRGVQGYRCTPGWDAVTGFGSIDGERLLQALLA